LDRAKRKIRQPSLYVPSYKILIAASRYKGRPGFWILLRGHICIRRSTMTNRYDQDNDYDRGRIERGDYDRDYDYDHGRMGRSGYDRDYGRGSGRDYDRERMGWSGYSRDYDRGRIRRKATHRSATPTKELNTE
jgi:hypothetical protein